MSKELNKANTELSLKAQEHLSVDPVTGVASRPDNFSELLMPADITPELVKKVDTWKQGVNVAVGDAFAKKSLEAVQASQAAGGSLNVTTLDMDVGYKDNVHMQYTARLELPDDKVEYGHLSVVTTTYAGQSSAQMRTAMKLAADAANRALNSNFVEPAESNS